MFVLVDERRCVFRTESGEHDAGIGTGVLGAELASDPPRPEELANAIGIVHDVLDDVLRVLPEAATAEVVEVAGPAVTAIADVEVGARAVLPLELRRDAAEDVFRTVATERRAARARNPGLVPEHVDDVVAAACVLVALMRRLRLDLVRIVGAAATHNGQP